MKGADAVPLFVRMRGAYFHEDGYSFKAHRLASDEQWPGTSVVFISLDEQGKSKKIRQLQGRIGSPDPHHLIVRLNPWPDAAKARVALERMSAMQPGALAGDSKAKQSLGEAWIYLLARCLPKDNPTKCAAMFNLYGESRVKDLPHVPEALASLSGPGNTVHMVSEALTASG